MPSNNVVSDDEIRSRVFRALEQLLGVQDLDIHVEFAYVEANTIEVQITSRLWQCAFTAPALASHEDMVVRIQRALLTANIGRGSNLVGALARDRS